MKKIFSFFLALVMMFALCACGGGGQPTPTEAPAPTAEPIVEPTTPVVKAGLICLHDENSTYDKNFIDAFKETCESMGIEYLIKTGIGESDEAYSAASELADSGCNFVFADSFGHEDYMIQAALEFPEVEFCHATGTKAHTDNIPNFHNAFASIYEGRYLAGIAAGMKLAEIMGDQEPIVGYVGALPYAEVISGYSAFYLGVKSIVPEATMVVTFTGSWYDETAEKEAALALMEKGAIVMSAHADSMGMPTACETRNVPFVAYNGSFMAACPNNYIISTRINWAPYIKYCIESIQNGTPIATDWVGTIDTGSVEMCELNEAAAAKGTADALKDIKGQFATGLHVFDVSKFTFEGENLTSYLADVDSDANYTPDTEVVKDGYFHESEYRSAPYFDIAIDGITVLS